MATKRNKQYRPRTQNPNPLSPHLTKVEIDGLKQLGILALAHMAENLGTQRHWCDLACRLMVGRAIVMKYFKEQEVGERIHNSIARLVQIYGFECDKPNGTWNLPELDFEFVKECLETIDEMLPMITRKEYSAVYVPIAGLQINALVKENCTWAEYLARTTK